MPQIYPFTAIVGQERMKRALILNAVDPRIGGVLIRGERGTAKSTAARALAALLPMVKVVVDAGLAVIRKNLNTWCTECQERIRNGMKLPIKVTHDSLLTCRFLQLKIELSEFWILNVRFKKANAVLNPGVLAAANRGLLYIDEVNLLMTMWWMFCLIRQQWA